jgi:hypothetical protein
MMSKIFDIGSRHDRRGEAGVDRGKLSIVTYSAYLVIVSARAGDRPLTGVHYVTPLLWIANVLHLGFTLSAIVAAAAKIITYRRGFPGW